MNYRLLISRAAQKEFTFIPKEFALALKEHILKLKDEPRPAGCKKLKDRDGWRFRFSNYRVIYEIDDNSKIVTILHVGHRKDVYR
ncbi:MAG: type II toxin-antitoxin system RelE/ParE family toxin [Bacteroidetes bacterium]|nr:MAG: type II toxin-antitoxin system RelE/ParE family toxin [Bacteroidota bacterium]